jgi:hypothetical protein
MPPVLVNHWLNVRLTNAHRDYDRDRSDRMDDLKG